MTDAPERIWAAANDPEYGVYDTTNSFEECQTEYVRIDKYKALEAHCDRLGLGRAERYWEGRWRDEAARVQELEDGLVNILDGQKAKSAILDIALDALNPPKETT